MIFTITKSRLRMEIVRSFYSHADSLAYEIATEEFYKDGG